MNNFVFTIFEIYKLKYICDIIVILYRIIYRKCILDIYLNSVNYCLAFKYFAFI